MKIQVKICGIRSLVAAQTAIYAGAKFLGFNFVSGSRRKISPAFAKQIIDQIKHQVKTVGVFQNQSLEEVNKIVEMLDLDYVQLHGEENQEYIDAVVRPVIKTLQLESDFNLNEVVKTIKSFKVPYFLADRVKQGQGKMLNTEKLNILCKSYPIFVAGGLTPLNIVEVVREAEPFGVDVASGIEIGGVEDLEKIKSFLDRVKNA